jgi:hypothetical protein
MSLKGFFGGQKKSSTPVTPLTGNISAAPGQTQEERDAVRNKMQAELDAQRAAREARKAAAEMPAES